MNEARLRVTVGQRRAVLHMLSQAASFTSLEEFADELAVAVISAEDEKSRRIVVTRTPAGSLYAFGPYATAATAMKVLDSGVLAHVEGTRGAVLPLSPAPKSTAAKPKRPAAAKASASRPTA